MRVFAVVLAVVATAYASDVGPGPGTGYYGGGGPVAVPGGPVAVPIVPVGGGGPVPVVDAYAGGPAPSAGPVFKPKPVVYSTGGPAFGGAAGAGFAGRDGVAYAPGPRGTFGGVFNRGGGGPEVGRVSTLDSFPSPLSGGAAAGGGGLQVGSAQVSIRDRDQQVSSDQNSHQARKYDNADAGAGRQDYQQRRGDLTEAAYNKEDQQQQGSDSQENRNYDQKIDQSSWSSQRQTDVNDKHGTGLDSNGRYDRQDVAKNYGDKALAANKNAFAKLNQKKENVDYGFLKDFDTTYNERGGFKEAVAQDNNFSDVYEENQRDNRFSLGKLDAFRRSHDNDAFQKKSDWLSNAAQKQNVNNQFGAADRLRNAAKSNDADYNSLLDRRNDVFWHRDSAQDKAVRQANDVAHKRAEQDKKAEANASGKKGVTDSKYYGGGSFNGGQAAPGVVLGTGADGGYANTGYAGAPGGAGPVVGSGVVAAANVAGAGVTGPGGVKGRQEGSGGDYVNQYKENALQSDRANQQQSSAAQSDATALNDYNRGRGVDDSITVKGEREGKWAKDRAGLKDANSNGYNGANADVAKAAALADNSLDARVSDSSLNAANKNLQAQELDRVNYKRNQVDNTQNIKKQKKFYHDKNEGGFNNEALRYNRFKDNKDAGEEQQARKAARTRYNNAADDAKVNQMGRAYNNLDARRISDADATSRTKDNSGGWVNENRKSQANALKNKAVSDNARQNTDFDSFSQNTNNRNRQLWDKARQELSNRQRGTQKDRGIDGSFFFTPDTRDRGLGLGGTAGGSTTFGGPARYGGGFGGARFGSSSGFMAPIGQSKFGATFGGPGKKYV